MKAVGIIAEYNPFHNGHKYQIEQARRMTDADYVIVVMSGSFVQRGTPAWKDKYLRTQIALECGADMVFELPTAYATASAKDFAFGGVSLLQGLGFVDTLCFGSECGDIHALWNAAQFLADPGEAFETTIRELVGKGLSYPAARAQAYAMHAPTDDIAHPQHTNRNGTLDDIAHPQGTNMDGTLNDMTHPQHIDMDSTPDNSSTASYLLQSPNNILGIEYLLALKQLHSKIIPVTIARKDHGYHETTAKDKYLSATGIRDYFLTQGKIPVDYLPAEAVNILQAARKHYPVTLDDFSEMLYYRLSTCSPEDMTRCADVSYALAARIHNLLPKYKTASDFIELLKTKQYTHSRISRALLHLLLHTTGEQTKLPVSYGNLLGFRGSASGLLRQVNDFPIITKKADALCQFHKLTEASAKHAISLWNTDLLADNLYRQCLLHKTGCALPDCYHAPLIIPRYPLC